MRWIGPAVMCSALLVAGLFLSTLARGQTPMPASRPPGAAASRPVPPALAASPPASQPATRPAPPRLPPVPEVTLQGFALCAHSGLREGREHLTVLLVLDDKTGKETRYYLAPNDAERVFHKQVEYVTLKVAATGVLAEKDGRKVLAASRIVEADFAYPPAATPAANQPAKPTGTPINLTIGKDLSLTCVPIPAGTFVMGSPFIQVPRYYDELPHEVTLRKAFHISATPVTQEQYEAVMDSNPSPHKGAKNAVAGVSWEQMGEFCRRLAEKNGRTVRLPTEAEWEYACRCGSSARYTGPAQFEGQVWPEGEGTHPVGAKKPNAWGLYDMLGSEWEMCGDWYADYPGLKFTDPTGPASGSTHVARGGYFAGQTRPTLRHPIPIAGSASNDPGFVVTFRIMVDPTPFATTRPAATRPATRPALPLK